MAAEPEPVVGARAPAAFSLGLLLAFCIGQLGLHAVMAGLRMAAPLQLLREGYGAGAVGFMLALFAAAPVLTAMPAGRLVDRYGYHRPVLLALLSSAIGAVLAIASTFTDGALHFGLLCMAAMATGVGANTGVMAIMRTAGLLARDSTERLRVFSWLSVAPAFANVIGPVSAGVMIDLGGFLAAYVLLGGSTGLALWGLLRVPRSIGASHQSPAAGGSALDLLADPGFKRLLLANWLIATCWDAHTFAVPILGHEGGFSASTIGLILGLFTLAVSVIRLVIPLLAHRIEETQVLRATMWISGLIMVAYPFAPNAWVMATLSILLGFALGCSQPMVMATLHHLVPPERHGQALALRSMTLNLASTLMPMTFGLAGAAIGTTVLFWVCGVMSAAGSWTVRKCPTRPANDVPARPS